jgi:predicted RNA binding protein YcfA (HicA-like mRNA interferase family)
LYIIYLCAPQNSPTDQRSEKAGFEQVSGAGKGSHRKFVQDRFSGAVTLSGKEGADAKQYQEREVKNAIEKIKQ